MKMMKLIDTDRKLIQKIEKTDETGIFNDLVDGVTKSISFPSVISNGFGENVNKNNETDQN